MNTRVGASSLPCSGTTLLFRRFAHRPFSSLALLLSAFLLSLLPASAEEQPPTQRVGLPITLTDIYIPGGAFGGRTSERKLDSRHMMAI